MEGKSNLLLFVTSDLRIARALRMESNACSANWSRKGGGGGLSDGAMRIPPAGGTG